MSRINISRIMLAIFKFEAYLFIYFEISENDLKA